MILDDRKTGAPNPYLIHDTHNVRTYTYTYSDNRTYTMHKHTQNRETGKKIVLVLVCMSVCLPLFGCYHEPISIVVLPIVRQTRLYGWWRHFPFFPWCYLYVVVYDYPPIIIHIASIKLLVQSYFSVLLPFICMYEWVYNMWICRRRYGFEYVCVCDCLSVCMCPTIEWIYARIHTHARVSFSFSTQKWRVYVWYVHIFIELNFYAAWMLYGFYQKPTC